MRMNSDKLKPKGLGDSGWTENEALYMGNYRKYRQQPQICEMALLCLVPHTFRKKRKATLTQDDKWIGYLSYF